VPSAFPVRLAVGPRTGSDPTAELTTFQSFSLTQNTTDGCTLTLNLPASSIAARSIDELATDVWVFIDDEALVRYRVMTVNQAWTEDGGDTIDVTGNCYRRLLFRRRLNNNLSFSGVGQGSIVWQMIQDTQSAPGGDLGITAGTLDAATTRDREYLRGDVIGQRIAELTQVIDGPRWSITPAGVLNVLAGDSWPTFSEPLIRGVNLRSMRRESGADFYGNAAYGTGDTLATYLEIVEDAGVATDPRGRWDIGASWPSVSSQATLAEHTAGALLEAVSPAAVWKVTFKPEWWVSSGLRIGDIRPLVVPRSTVAPVVPQAQVDVQVVDLNVTLTADGDLQVSGTAVELPSAG